MAKRILVLFLFTLVPLLGLAQQVAQDDDGPVLVINDDSNVQAANQAANDDLVQFDSGQTDDSQAIDLSGAGASRTTSEAVHSAARVYGPITNEDHIWSLAQKLRPDASVSLQQMVIALQKANPNAFSQNNINGLKNGEMLRVPSLVTIQAVSAKEAQTLVEQQNQAWGHKTAIAPVAAAAAVSVAPVVRTPIVKKPVAAKTVPQTVAPKTAVPKLVVAAIKPAAPAKPVLATLPLPVPVAHNLIMAKTSTDVPTEVKNLQQQVLATQSELTNYKEASDARIKTLEQQNALIASQMLVFNERLAGLKDQFNAKLDAINKNANWPASPAGYMPRSKIAWLILAGSLILVALLWFPLPKKEKLGRRKEPVVHMEEDAELKDEYDFMNTKEAIPAKLDLARAYINMDDFSSAQQVLRDVVKKGNPNERQQAEQLLSAFRI